MQLGRKNVWWDEAWTIGVTRETLIEATLRVAADVHPPLYFWNLHAWTALVGETEFATRFLSVTWGLVTVALVYPLTQKVASRQVALLAMLLTASSRFHVWWSQEVRMYVFAAFAVTLSLYLFKKALENGTRIWWIIYALGSIPVLYSFYLAGVVFVAQNAFVLLTLRRRLASVRRFTLKWVGSQLIILAAFVPWVVLAARQMRTWSTSSSFAPRLFLQLYATVLSVGVSTHINRWLIPTVALTLIAATGLVALWRGSPNHEREGSWRAAAFVTLPIVLLPASVYLVSLNRGVFYSPRIEARYLVLFLPLFSILVACGIVAIGQRFRSGGWIALILVLGLNGWVLADYHAGRYVRDTHHTAMLTLKACADPNDGVMLVSGNRYPVFLYYYERFVPADRRPEVHRLPSAGADVVTPGNVDAQLAPIAAKHDRLWLASFERQMQDPHNLVEAWLNERYAHPLEVAQGHNHLALYTHDEKPPVVRTLDPERTFDRPLNGGRLLGVDLPAQEFRPGDTAHLGLYVGGGSGSFEVRWTGADGLVLGTRRVKLVGDGAIHRYDVPFHVAYGPPGRYRFTLADGTALARMAVRRTDHVPSKHVVEHPVEVTLGESTERVKLLGYDLSSERTKAGRELTVTLYWQAPSSIAKSYTAFVQLVGPHNPATGNPLWGQHDDIPVGGTFPTNRWPTDLIVRDRHDVPIDPDAQPGGYQLIVGLYDPATGERLDVPDASNDAVALQTVTITE